MGTTFKQLKNKLKGAIDVVPASFLPDAINDALRDIYDAYDWGFLWKDSYIRTPAVISGRGSIIKYGTTLTLDAATKALVNAQGAVVENIPLNERQIKFFGTSKVDRAFYYNIVPDSYDSIAGTLEIDPLFLDDTNASIQLEIVKVYYTAPTIIINGEPVIDFKRFAYVFSPYYERKLNIYTTLDQINSFDPIRSANGDPRHFVPYGVDSFGNQLWEMYPVPKNEKVFRVKYLRRGTILSGETETIFDNVISAELVLSRAKQKAYEWVIANQEKLQMRSVVGITNLIALLNNPNNPSSYPVLLQKAKDKDEELFPKAYAGDFAEYPYYEDLYYDPDLIHDRLGDTLVIDANA